MSRPTVPWKWLMHHSFNITSYTESLQIKIKNVIGTIGGGSGKNVVN
jgi:hypothetical protein